MCAQCMSLPPTERATWPLQAVSSDFHFASRNPRLAPVTETPCIMWHMTLTYSLTNHGLIRVMPSFYYESCAYSWRSFSLLHMSALLTIALCVLHQVSAAHVVEGWKGVLLGFLLYPVVSLEVCVRAVLGDIHNVL